jgi:hypothetical protein
LPAGSGGSADSPGSLDSEGGGPYRKSLRFSPTRCPIKQSHHLFHGLLRPIHPAFQAQQVLPVPKGRIYLHPLEVHPQGLLRFPGVRRDPAPKGRPPLVPHIPIDRFRALPIPGLPSPETSGESPDSGEGRRRPGPPPGPARTPGNSPRVGRPQAKASRWPAWDSVSPPGRLSSSDPQGMARPRWGVAKSKSQNSGSDKSSDKETDY